MPVDIQQIITEIERGLNTEAKDRMDQAQVNIEHYRFQSEALIFEYLRDSESPFDLRRRPFNDSGLMHEIVNILTDHMYAPGPSREWSEPAGKDFLGRVYADNFVDAVMGECDVLSHCADAAAVQVDAYEGTFEDRPITLRVWGADEFHVWEDPDNRAQPVAVVTKDKYDQTTRFRLWTDEQIHTFETAKGQETAGGRVATRVGTEENPYQCLPFAFTHYHFPVRQFWNPGIGDFLHRGDLNANVLLSRVSEAILKHMNPLPFIKNGYPGMRLVIEPQRFIVMGGPRKEMGPKGVETVEGPEPFYLQASIDVAAAWEHLRGCILQLLKAVGIPQSAVEIDYTTAPSGIMLIINLWPLIQRVRRRRVPWGLYETDLARCILRCAGTYYKRQDLIRDAKAGSLALGWPATQIPITQDWLDTERTKIEMGLTSLIKTVMAMLGVPREQAITYLEGLQDDQKELERINPDLVAPPEPEPPPPPPPGQNGQPVEEEETIA